MSKKGERLLCILIVLAAVLSALSAATITWSWIPGDAAVNYYRYRLEGEKWTTVGADVTSYVQNGADSTRSYTLSLQQSYDGRFWSEIAYCSTVPVEREPIVQLEEEVAIEPQDPIVEAEAQMTENGMKFSLLFKGGVSNRIEFDPFTFANGTDFMRVNTGIAFDAASIIPVGNHFGFGLRSDLSLDIIVAPDVGGWKGINKDNFYKMGPSYDYDTGIDLKLMAEAHWKVARIYLGGGVGYSLFNQADTDEARETHTLKAFKLFGISFDSAWYASAVAGISFNLTEHFSLGAEAGYRFMLPAKSHIASADLVIGFTF